MKRFKINKDTRVSEIIRKYPKTIFVFLDNGLHCIGCPMAHAENGETIEQAAKAHRIDLKKLLKELNESINKK